VSNVIQFPDNEPHDWANMKRTLAEILDDMDLSENFKGVVLGRMKLAYEKMHFSYEFEVEAPQVDYSVVSTGLSGFEQEFGEHMGQMLIDRLMLEIELAAAKGIS
jgi:hypothetical protein